MAFLFFREASKDTFTEDLERNSIAMKLTIMRSMNA